MAKKIRTDFEVELAHVKKLRKRLGRVRIGLPEKVVFTYKQGVVSCIPKQRKWIIEIKKGTKLIEHRLHPDLRNDVTKHRARHFLKAAIAGVLRDDSKPKPLNP